MKPFEDEFRRALRRQEPPAGFAGRVMARVEQEAEARATEEAKARSRGSRGSEWLQGLLFGRRARLVFAAVAAVMLLAVSLSVWRERRQAAQMEAGERARAQVMEALRITGAKLNRVRLRVQQSTVGRGPERANDAI